jgi:V/A-type H+-transporting ATPase subunit D
VALKFQFNKTALAQLKKELKVRVRALPTLKAKETALRLEVKKAKTELADALKLFQESSDAINKYGKLWEEFPKDILQVKDVQKTYKKIAGVRIPSLGSVEFVLTLDSFFGMSAWTALGVKHLKESAKLAIEIEVAKERLSILEYARKKTTQKVNLYEKVQIPEYNEGILKIKRFMEDQENLEKSAQKILKDKLTQQEAA